VTGSLAALAPYGADDRVAALFATYADADLVPGRIARVDRDRSVVATAEGMITATSDELPGVGDWVALRPPRAEGRSEEHTSRKARVRDSPRALYGAALGPRDLQVKHGGRHAGGLRPGKAKPAPEDLERDADDRKNSVGGQKARQGPRPSVLDIGPDAVPSGTESVPGKKGGH
jgi:hypothetical protein